MVELKNKRILFFAPSFFGYEKKIKIKMEELGAKVDMFDERSISSSWQKSLLKINPDIFKRKTENYYLNILKNIGERSYDYVLFIKCEMATEKILTIYRNKFSKAKFCLYLYDSLINIKNIENKLKYFDFICSFDRNDCLKNKKIHFRPLFYCDEYKRNNIESIDHKYYLCFVGTVHSDRYKILKEIKELEKDGKSDIFFYPYLQSKFIYYFYKITKKEFRDTKIRDFKFDKISSKKISEIINDSNAVIDIQHPNQTGLTMRTIEMIGMNKKIVTTNKDIVNYDFYNPNNILVCSRNDFKIDRNFMERPYEKIPGYIYEKYSLHGWLMEVFGGDLK
ncbi:hypothetical protein [Thomasclavelia sp.]|uniref:hypothetical protein n=1 Tax=Thomasclavelia sp. TaxID=3025757 RepID=UPI0025EA4CB2|nr:hypothetical protein [Thomasclavelia sp.]